MSDVPVHIGQMAKGNGMNQDDLHRLKNWFADYVSSYKTGNADDDYNIILKEDHTLRVCKEVLYLGEAMELIDNDMKIAETMALLHDVGRFEQYRRFKTFSDAKSVDHAQFSISIIKEENVLDSFDAAETDLIIRSISYHNRMYLPEDETEKCLFFSRILRDADKIDIWKVFGDHCFPNAQKGTSAIIDHLPDTPGASEEICNDLIGGKCAKYTNAKNLNDYKLLQVGWIYDINFKPSFIRIWNRNYLQMLYDVLPRSKIIDEIFEVAQKYLNDRIGQQP
jgi:hypothetical protein